MVAKGSESDTTARPDTQKATDAPKGVLTSEQMIERLRSALRRDGDFPASAKIVSELRQLTSDPKTTANQITEVILREPSLGTRVLHLVNSSFYRRAKPIMTVSQAVIQIGMKPLAELCAGLILLQKFVPAARRGGTFANCLRKTVLSSLMASSISNEVKLPSSAAQGSNRNAEYGYLAATFAEIGTLLMAYYFPQVFEAAVKRAESKRIEIGQSIFEITGLTPIQLSLEVIDALNLPPFYKDVLQGVQQVKTSGAKSAAPSSKVLAQDPSRISQAVYASSAISEVIVSGRSKQELERIVSQVSSKLGVESAAFGKVLGEIPTVFRNHCQSIDLQLPPLPEYVASFSAAPSGGDEQKGDSEKEAETQFAEFVEEIRIAVENREPTSSIITSVMETLAWNIKFDRVMLMLINGSRNRLIGRLLLGDMPDFDPKKVSRPVGVDASPYAADAKAFRESRPIFVGEPVFEGGWPLAAIPIGFGTRCIGVIYADRDPLRSSNQEKQELNAREQGAVGILAELLDRSISVQG